MQLDRTSYVIIALIWVSLNVFVPSITRAESFGALGNPTGKPIGGGMDYGDWVSSTTIVDCKDELSAPVSPKECGQELRDVLESAQNGDVVYVADDVSIDLSDQWDILIPGGVTLASGRGRNGSLGGHLFTHEKDKKRNLFVAGGPDIRVTGLRIEGPSIRLDDPGCSEENATAIAVSAEPDEHYPFEIDNCEMWGWPSSAVAHAGGTGGHIHHNHIHHNRREERSEGCRPYGLGYGIVTSSGNILIEGNLFDHNRHDIASDGRPGTSYEARYNLVLDGAIQHSFDVHGFADPNDGTPIAGSSFHIHHNTFLQSHKPAFRIRGLPEKEARVHHNEFRHRSQSAAANQVNASGGLVVDSNATHMNHFPAWFVSFSGKSFWRLLRFENRELGATLWGDFNGDGINDALFTTGSIWELSSGARQDWSQWNVSTVTHPSLAVGDFDGDGKSDLVRQHRGEWLVSYGGSSSWQHLGTSTIPLSELVRGDFDCDGKTDFLRGNGAKWYLSSGGTSSWKPWNVSSINPVGLAVGDFDGNGCDDVIRSTGTAWFISRSASGPWEFRANSRTSVGDLLVGDFDGDGSSDFFRGNGRQWTVSWGGQSPWTVVQDSTFKTFALQVADVNGDGIDDVIARRTPN